MGKGDSPFEKLHTYDWIAIGILMRGPTRVLMALRADNSMGRPIDGKVSTVIAMTRLRLPTGIRSHGTDDLNALVSLTPYKHISDWMR